MDHNIIIDIPKPCAQQWAEMSPTANGKFCGHCSTEVIDFTKMTTAQLQLYFKHTTQPVCGRIDTFQLHQLNHPPVLHPKKVGFSLRIATASIMALFASTKVTAQQVVGKPQTIAHPSDAKDKVSASVKEKDVVATFTIKGKVTSLYDDLALEGASVKLVGSNQATSTDANGQFKFHVKGVLHQEITLSITYLSHSHHELKVKLEREPKEVTISLAPESIVLGKVSVTVPKAETRHIITGGITTTVKIEEPKRSSFFNRMLQAVSGWFR